MPRSELRHFSLEIFGQADEKYLETLTIDAAARTVEHEYSIDRQFGAKHAYALADPPESLLFALGQVLDHDAWHCTPVYDDNEGVLFFDLHARWADGSEETRSGIYSRAEIPEKPWRMFIVCLRCFCAALGFGELLSLRLFDNAAAPGEVKLCNVSFRPEGKDHQYQTQDEGIEPGDWVIVPVGKESAEKLALVRSVHFCAPDDAPYPIEKTRAVIARLGNEPDKLPADALGRLRGRHIRVVTDGGNIVSGQVSAIVRLRGRGNDTRTLLLRGADGRRVSVPQGDIRMLVV